MEKINFILGKVLSKNKIQKTKYGPKLVCYVNILKTNFKDFEYTSGTVQVVIWRESKIKQFENAYKNSKKSLLMITFEQCKELLDEYNNSQHAIKASGIQKITNSEYERFYCKNSLGQYDPFSRLIV
ncbi:hypothetical protein QU577_26920 [Priestia megaterium]|uniref:hypothetical protein n=1 Tax=Priestia megaterium TaxID=1404 RepID=UPI0025AED2C5|nr:hypothetical protein [Priestia megaterium]MDN3365399.1 hypothetical protein [Priestia megaterium]